MQKVYVVAGPMEGHSFAVKTDGMLIGRSPKNDFQIKDPTVSRRHLSIIIKGDCLFIEDLKSENGTYLSGNRLTPGIEYEILEGAPVVIGRSVLGIGAGCVESVQPFLNAIGLHKELNESGSRPVENRAKTAPENIGLIYKVSNLLMELEGIDEILERLLDWILDLLKRVDRGAIILVDPDTRQVNRVVSKSKKPVRDKKEVYSQEIVARVVREDKPVVIENAHEEAEGDFARTFRLLKIKSVMCIPLISGRHAIGALYVDSIDKPYGFRNGDLFLLSDLSCRITPIIERALLFDALEDVD